MTGTCVMRCFDVAEITEERPACAAHIAEQGFALYLVYSAGELEVPPQRWPLTARATPIGREVAGLALPHDRRASRLHATLQVGAGSSAPALHVVDEHSRNGTTVNGRRVDRAPLRDGDVLGIGDSLLVVRLERPQAIDRPGGARDAAVPSMIGVSSTIAAAREALALAAPTDATVLLLADSGCGKEVAARALHALSGRQGPFVAVNCSAIPESLAESQLFGQVVGAFTGAIARPGLFRAAHGGTLFLDEIGDLPSPIQPKLLRVLEERAVLPVGATAPVEVETRIVAATNLDLAAAIAAQRFRGDLYARLAQLEVRLPRLRERREDVLLLVEHALRCGGYAPVRLTPALAQALLCHPWPFNVRELLAVAQQLRLRGARDQVLDLPLVAERLAAPSPASLPPTSALESDDAELADAAERHEPDDYDAPDRLGLEAMLRDHRGVISDVARVARRSRKQVYRWIASHGLDVAHYRSESSGRTTSS
jgi:DNA-binding NtrC family response regulator